MPIGTALDKTDLLMSAQGLQQTWSDVKTAIQNADVMAVLGRRYTRSFTARIIHIKHWLDYDKRFAKKHDRRYQTLGYCSNF